MFTMSLKSAKSGFFDRAAVVRAVDQATRRNLSRFGAYVRQRAKTSIRRPPKNAAVRISRPGRPPYSHTGLLKRFIFFAYDADRQSVVIGPVRLRNSDGMAPTLLEHGGVALRARRRRRYRPRPYMHPAFDAEMAALPDLWKNSVKANQ